MKVKPKNKENKPFGKVNFTYKPEEDIYICPNNKILPFQKEYFSNGTTKKLYYTTEYKYCHNQTECAGHNQYKTITEYETESRRNMAIKFEDPKEKETYKKRSTIENSLWKPDKKPRIQTNKLIRTTKRQNRTNTTHNSNKPQKNIQQNNRKLKKYIH